MYLMEATELQLRTRPMSDQAPSAPVGIGQVTLMSQPRCEMTRAGSTQRLLLAMVRNSFYYPDKASAPCPNSDLTASGHEGRWHASRS